MRESPDGPEEIELDAELDALELGSLSEPGEPGEPGEVGGKRLVMEAALRFPVRLDAFLTERLGGISRAKVQRLIALGAVMVNGQAPKPATKLVRGDVVDVMLPPAASSDIVAEPIPLEVIFEDEHLLVINKGKGIIVHPARGIKSGTMLNAIAHHLKERHAAAALSGVGAAEERPGVVHRLDRHTTGVILFAKRDETHWAVARQFEHRSCLKAYLALVHGNPSEASGVIDQPLGKHPTIREAIAVRQDSTSRPSVTLFRVREQYAGYALVELELKTGRTHQIRVHLTWMGHPIVGDVLYGGEPVGLAELDHPPIAAGSRAFVTYARTKAQGGAVEAAAAARGDVLLATPALHAAMLRIVHPQTKREMTFTAPVEPGMAQLIERLRSRRIAGPVAEGGTWVDLDRALPTSR